MMVCTVDHNGEVRVSYCIAVIEEYSYDVNELY